jgi:hypothetical protein
MALSCVDIPQIRTEVPQVSIVQLPCDRCAAVTGFEQPRCRDGHGADCAEWACVVCGAALLVAPFTVELDRRRTTTVRRRTTSVRSAA